MSASHPNPSLSAVQWVRDILPGRPVADSWPLRPSARFVVVTTTVARRNAIGFIERWTLNLISVAPDQDEAMGALHDVIAAAQAVNTAPAVRSLTLDDSVTSFAFTRGDGQGPNWQSAEVTALGPMDVARATVSLQVRIYP